MTKAANREIRIKIRELPFEALKRQLKADFFLKTKQFPKVTGVGLADRNFNIIIHLQDKR